jgi:hypothetical protein
MNFNKQFEKGQKVWFYDKLVLGETEIVEPGYKMSTIMITDRLWAHIFETQPEQRFRRVGNWHLYADKQELLKEIDDDIESLKMYKLSLREGHNEAVCIDQD